MSKIARRDFINGALMMAGTSVLPNYASSQIAMAALQPSYYPPSLNGLRGSHPGSNEQAHARAWNKQTDWGQTSDLKEEYDLVVVGGGISGLAAAYFYQQEHGRGKKILILDNHDDFGGHAKRNEHDVEGNLLIGEGGSESIEQTRALSSVVLNLFDDLGLNLDRFKITYDSNFFKKHGLGAATYFNKKVFGEDKLVKHPYGDYPGFMEGLLKSTLSYEQAAEEAPLSKMGKQQLLRVMQGNPKILNIPKSQWQQYIQTHSYFDYLTNTLGVDNPGILTMARNSIVDYGGTPDTMTMQEAIEGSALGMNAINWKDAFAEGSAPVDYIDKGDGTYAAEDPFIHHFPDGNATIARMLVKKMVPEIGPGENVEEIVLSRFNYDKLDLATNNVRIRLSSTVVNVKHLGNPHNSDAVAINYVQGKKSYAVKAKNTILACYNMMIPHIVSDLPEDQYIALSKLSKIPLQFSNVGLKNWRAMKEIGVGMAMSPGNIHQAINMDFPVSVGGYEYTKSPDDPCILHMRCCLQGDTPGAPSIQQFKEARYRMLGLKFSDYEMEIRSHLNGMFPKNLFNFDRDVQSITINRWAHGYSYGNAGPVGRRPFGRITIANSDAVNSSLVQRAIDEAWRAVNELG